MPAVRADVELVLTASGEQRVADDADRLDPGIDAGRGVAWQVDVDLLPGIAVAPAPPERQPLIAETMSVLARRHHRVSSRLAGIEGEDVARRAFGQLIDWAVKFLGTPGQRGLPLLRLWYRCGASGSHGKLRSPPPSR